MPAVKVRELASMRLYPNPAESNLNMVLPETFNGTATLECISASGASYKFPAVNIQNGTFKVDVRNMPEGMYTVLVKGQGQVFQSRFVKK
jgi:hypothetical protein